MRKITANAIEFDGYLYKEEIMSAAEDDNGVITIEEPLNMSEKRLQEKEDTMEDIKNKMIEKITKDKTKWNHNLYIMINDTKQKNKLIYMNIEGRFKLLEELTKEDQEKFLDFFEKNTEIYITREVKMLEQFNDLLERNKSILEENQSQRPYGGDESVKFNIKSNGPIEIENREKYSEKEINQLFEIYTQIHLEAMIDEINSIGYEKVYTDGRSGGWLIIEDNGFDIEEIDNKIEELEEFKEEFKQIVQNIKNNNISFEDRIEAIDELMLDFSIKELDRKTDDLNIVNIRGSIEEIEEIIERHKKEYENNFNEFLKINAQSNANKNKLKIN